MTAPLSLLVLDDEPNVLASLRRGLARARPAWRTEYFEHPQAALAHLRTARVDVVMTDHHMPGMAGLDFITAAQDGAKSGAEQRARTPHFIVLTGAGDYALALDAINQRGVSKFLTKPCATDVLVTAIEELHARPVSGAHSSARDTPRPLNNPQTQLAHAALELFATAVVVVDAVTNALVYTNAEGERLLAAPDTGLTRDERGVVRGRTSDTSRALHTLIASVSPGRNESAFIALPRGDGARDMCLVARALPQTTGEPARIALLVTDPNAPAVPEPSAIVALFDLTNAEALIARALATGLDVPAAAAANGVTLETARTYLKRAYSKTGVSGQRDLVKLMLSAPRLVS